MIVPGFFSNVLFEKKGPGTLKFGIQILILMDIFPSSGNGLRSSIGLEHDDVCEKSRRGVSEGFLYIYVYMYAYIYGYVYMYAYIYGYIHMKTK